MNTTHVVLTKSGGADKNLRLIQPFNGYHLAFGETPDGQAVAYYAGREAEEIKEPFVHIMRTMVASGMALDCTGGSYEAPADTIENLKKQLAAKDDELTSLKKQYREYFDAGACAHAECEKMGVLPKTALSAVLTMRDELSRRGAEIRNLKLRLKKWEDHQATQMNSGFGKQPEPPQLLSDEAQGLKDGEIISHQHDKHNPKADI